MDDVYFIIPLLLLGSIIGGSTGFGMFLVVGPALWWFYGPTEAMAIGFSAGLASPLLLFSLWKDIDWKK